MGMHSDPQPLAPLVRSLRAGDHRPTTLVDDLCDRLDAVDDDVGAVLPEPGRRDRLIREATALDARHDDPASRPPLFGVPVGIKDIFHVDGLPTRAGSVGGSPRRRSIQEPSARAVRNKPGLEGRVERRSWTGNGVVITKHAVP